VTKQVVLQVLFPDLIIGMVVYFVVNIILFETEKVLSNIRGEYYLAENALSYIAGSFGAIPFNLEATTAGHLKLMNIYIMLYMNGYFGIVRAYSEASKSSSNRDPVPLQSYHTTAYLTWMLVKSQ
jgi:hypothetical protein